jgi:two-component system, NtrC family, response regulator AtoC
VDLRSALENGTFREDLYYRLNVLPLNVPALRERKEDIPYLAEHFAAKFEKEIGREAKISDAAMQKLMAYNWPGNVRELENVLERSIVLAPNPELQPADIRLDMSPRSKAPQVDTFLPQGMSLDEYEQSIIREALKRADGNKSHAARLLGITRNALRYRLSQMGIESAEAHE